MSNKIDRIRECAYYLWEKYGLPADENWREAEKIVDLTCSVKAEAEAEKIIDLRIVDLTCSVKAEVDKGECVSTVEKEGWQLLSGTPWYFNGKYHESYDLICCEGNQGPHVYHRHIPGTRSDYKMVKIDLSDPGLLQPKMIQTSTYIEGVGSIIMTDFLKEGVALKDPSMAFPSLKQVRDVTNATSNTSITESTGNKSTVSGNNTTNNSSGATDNSTSGNITSASSTSTRSSSQQNVEVPRYHISYEPDKTKYCKHCFGNTFLQSPHGCGNV